MNLRMPPVVLNLILLNVIVYIVTHFLAPGLQQYFVLFYPTPHGLFQPYQLITYMFGHETFLHIFLNMLALWMLGSQVEMVWGGKKFLFFYIVCGLGAAGFNLLIYYIKLQTNQDPAVYASLQNFYSFLPPMLGASGSVFGILAAFGMLFPNQMLMMLFPPIPMKAKYFVILYGAIELFSGISNNSGDNVAHFAHIGGLITGLIMLLIWRQLGSLYSRVE